MGKKKKAVKRVPKEGTTKLSLLNPGEVFRFGDNTDAYMFLRNVYLKPLGESEKLKGLTDEWGSFLKLGGHSLCIKISDPYNLVIKSMDMYVIKNTDRRADYSESDLYNLVVDIHNGTVEIGFDIWGDYKPNLKMHKVKPPAKKVRKKSKRNNSLIRDAWSISKPALKSDLWYEDDDDEEADDFYDEFD